MRKDVVIIGGGIAGLQCARDLRRTGRGITVLERAAKVGGRCATQRFDGQPIDTGPMLLHGHVATFLEAIREVPGARLPSPWPTGVQGLGQPCQPSTFQPDEQRAILAEGLDSFARHLATDLDVQLGCTATQVAHAEDGFTVTLASGDRLACGDLVIALALEETLSLLATFDPSPEIAGMQALLSMFASVPALTVVAAYPVGVPEPAWDLLYPDDQERLQLIAVDSRKRENPKHLTLVIQARPWWSRKRLDRPEAAWAEELLDEAADCVGSWVRTPVWTSTQSWRYARVDRGNELARPLLARFPSGARLGLAGDVFAPGGGVQAAWLSGSALAQRLLTEE